MKTGRKPKYEWDELAVDGYFIADKIKIQSARSMCSTLGKAKGKKFRAEKDGELIKITRKQ